MENLVKSIVQGKLYRNFGRPPFPLVSKKGTILVSGPGIVKMLDRVRLGFRGESGAGPIILSVSITNYRYVLSSSSLFFYISMMIWAISFVYLGILCKEVQ